MVAFKGRVTEAIAKLARSEAFRGCTTRGVAAGVKALRLELYSDLLLALETDFRDEKGVPHASQPACDG